MKKLNKCLSAVLALSFVAAILVLALTPAPVEAGAPTISWIVRTDSGFYGSLLATRKMAKCFCGVEYLDRSVNEYKGTIIYISKEGKDHNICRFK